MGEQENQVQTENKVGRKGIIVRAVVGGLVGASAGYLSKAENREKMLEGVDREAAKLLADSIGTVVKGRFSGYKDSGKDRTLKLVDSIKNSAQGFLPAKQEEDNRDSKSYDELQEENEALQERLESLEEKIEMLLEQQAADVEDEDEEDEEDENEQEELDEENEDEENDEDDDDDEEEEQDVEEEKEEEQEKKKKKSSGKTKKASSKKSSKTKKTAKEDEETELASDDDTSS
ncbi:GvpT/GvpP family gas vesicle accessory protein [Priestia koreensis]|uniref:GvpT/GvpP family gas vesicle accessory protein n=1 Tax=Priestia koreensis TaxID=284581 RepID=UPI0006A9D443|nr:GvpT/GvpP family gas vesicle accessory protein [Priestia koreensis]